MASFLSTRAKKSRTRIACPALFGRATHEAHPAPRAKGVAGSGSHSPLVDRQARLSVSECRLLRERFANSKT